MGTVRVDPAPRRGTAVFPDLASACHPRTLRQMRWTNTMIKNLSPQILPTL
ncbi:hypothetical protein AB0L67_18075 [Streptomyces flaveolus]|uniref:hypothetical protein n=1 Tax=Streptomyces flaveolus TaxID=67297 RepID=UPI003446C140